MKLCFALDAKPGDCGKMCFWTVSWRTELDLLCSGCWWCSLHPLPQAVFAGHQGRLVQHPCLFLERHRRHHLFPGPLFHPLWRLCLLYWPRGHRQSGPPVIWNCCCCHSCGGCEFEGELLGGQTAVAVLHGSGLKCCLCTGLGCGHTQITVFIGFMQHLLDKRSTNLRNEKSEDSWLHCIWLCYMILPGVLPMVPIFCFGNKRFYCMCSFWRLQSSVVVFSVCVGYELLDGFQPLCGVGQHHLLLLLPAGLLFRGHCVRLCGCCIWSVWQSQHLVHHAADLWHPHCAHGSLALLPNQRPPHTLRPRPLAPEDEEVQVEGTGSQSPSPVHIPSQPAFHSLRLRLRSPSWFWWAYHQRPEHEGACHGDCHHSCQADQNAAAQCRQCLQEVTLAGNESRPRQCGWWGR